MPEETILVVEDNDILRGGLKDLLNEAGYSVLAAIHGEDALGQMRDNPPDLILADIVMPVMDGYTFYKAVRAHQEYVSIPFIFLTARRDREDVFIGRQLGVDDYIIKPVTQSELITTVRSRLARKQELLFAQIQESYESILIMLADAVDARDHYPPGRAVRVMKYAQEIAKQSGWTTAQQNALQFGAILHDIGKIFIRESTLRKTEPLNEEEWLEIKRHPELGAEILKDIPLLASAIPIIRYHHERWDGMGYPEGLKGRSIPWGARIVSIADSFDAMTTDRVYRPAMSNQQAYEAIIRSSGTSYDPAVVLAFKQAWDRGEIQKILNERKV